MPSTVPAVYLVNPVQCLGTEGEGSTGSPNVDTSTSVPVVVLAHVPSVGDIIPAYMAGGRWVSDCGAGSCSVTICVMCAAVNVSGAIVTISSGGTQVAQGTTGSGGCVTLSIPSARTYTVTVQATGYATYSATQALSCGKMVDVQLCGCEICLPAVGTLTLTITLTNGGTLVWTLESVSNHFYLGGNGVSIFIELSCDGSGPFYFKYSSAAGNGWAIAYPTCAGSGVQTCCVLDLGGFSCDPVDITLNPCGYPPGFVLLQITS
jgi:hypothetical protein